MSYNELSGYYEQISHRSTAYRGQSVGGNLTNTTGEQPADSRTVAGGQNVQTTSTNMGGSGNEDNAGSQLKDEFAVVNIPDNPLDFASSNKSEPLTPLVGGQQNAFIGNAAPAVQAGSSFGGYDITR